MKIEENIYKAGSYKSLGHKTTSARHIRSDEFTANEIEIDSTLFLFDAAKSRINPLVEEQIIIHNS